MCVGGWGFCGGEQEVLATGENAGKNSCVVALHSSSELGIREFAA